MQQIDQEYGKDVVFDLTCEEFAELNKVKPQSVRARICKFGSYFGIKPKKQANGRLLFPRVQLIK